MSFKYRLRIVAPFALAAVALGMTACSPGDPDSTPTVTVTAAAEESSTTEPTTETSEPTMETSEPMMSESPSEAPSSMGPNDESGVVDVTVAGDQGILALQHSGAVPTGDAGPTNQKLITGPGGCFALTNQGKPQLVVFPAEATFVLKGDCTGKKDQSCGKPSATIDGTEHFVGRQFNVSTIVVPKTSVAGIPDRCMQGSDDTVVVVG